MKLLSLGVLVVVVAGIHAAVQLSPLQVQEAAVNVPSSVGSENVVESLDFEVGAVPIGTPRGTTIPPVYHSLPVGELGTARGVLLKSLYDRDFYGFMSLPYAKPPVGDLRFKYPEAWEGPWPQETGGQEYDATWLRARCPQKSLVLDVIAGREDCLHLSIYTALVPVENDLGSGLPVMVFIHGGAFMTGDAFIYVPTKLMERDVLVVVVQYRLSLLGFLAGGVEEAPGNMGLMDQVTALRWVQKYISHFGGDPDLVTVFGQSAGGSSSSWMHLTPLTQASNNNGKQLLHRVIPQSGSTLDVWSIDDHPEESFERTARMMDCWIPSNTEETMACMRGKSYQEVIKTSIMLYQENRKNGELGFNGQCPVVQSDMQGSGLELVIPKQPLEILAAGEFLNIPVMSGNVRDEGSFLVGLIWTDYMVPLNISVHDEDFTKFELIPMILKTFDLNDKNAAMSNSMRLAYLPNAEMGNWESMVGGLVDLCGVMFLKSGLWELVTKAQQAVSDLPVYFYSWEFENDDSLFGWIFISSPDIPVEGGICHADELIYLFHLPSILDAQQQDMARRMTLMWTNFAKYGNPTPDNHTLEEAWEDEVEEWVPFTADEQNFMLIKDDFVLELDFVTRWNYHINSTQPGTSTQTPGTSDTQPGISTPKPTTTTTTTTPKPDTVSQEDYDKVVDQREDFKIATGVLGGLTGCFLILAIILVLKMRRAGNAIV